MSHSQQVGHISAATSGAKWNAITPLEGPDSDFYPSYPLSDTIKDTMVNFHNPAVEIMDGRAYDLLLSLEFENILNGFVQSCPN
jgi:hypothetical protein